MKKQRYTSLVLLSLLGLPLGLTVLDPSQTASADDHFYPGFVSEKGSFYIGDSSINVREEPSTSAKVVATYDPGEKVNYDMVGMANGHRWISYVSHSGRRRYLAIGESNSYELWGRLDRKNPTKNSMDALGLYGGSHPTPNLNSSQSTWYKQKGYFIVGPSSINVRSKASTSADIVASYDPGEKINYDLRGSENGYDWISYESHSGKRRYVAIGKTSEPGYWGNLRPD